MVSQICWTNQPTKSSLLTCNARTIKLWSLKKRFQHKSESAKRLFKKGLGLVLPKGRPQVSDVEPVAKLCHTFKCGLENNLHSLSTSSDMLNFLSADEKSVNIWSLDMADKHTVFNLIDLNKKNTV